MRIYSRVILLLAFTSLLFASGLMMVRYQSQSAVNTALSGREAELGWILGSLLGICGQNLAVLAEDYSYWDEMVGFVQTRDVDWATENLATGAKTHDAQGVWVYDSHFVRVYAYRAEGRSCVPAAPVPVSVLKKAFAASRLVHFYVAIPGGVLEMRGASVHPTADRERRTAPCGYLLAGRVWDQQRFGALQRQLGGSLQLLPSSWRGAAPLLELRPGGVAYPHGPGGEAVVPAGADALLATGEPSGGQVVAVTRELRGWDGHAVARVRLVVPLPMVDTLSRQVAAATWLSVAFAATVLALIGWLLSVWVAQPLRLIRRSLQDEDPSAVASLVDTTSEIGSIASLIEEFFRQRSRLVATICEQQATAEALWASERRYRSLFEHSNDAIVVHDLGGRIIDANSRAVELLGYDVAELCRVGITGLHRAGELPRTRAAFEAARTDGHTRFETRLRRADGTAVDADVSVRVTDEESGTVQSVIRDITESKRSQDLLTRQRDLSFAILSAETLQEALQCCLEGALDAAGMECGGIYQPDPSGPGMALTHAIGVSDEFRRAAARFGPQDGPPMDRIGGPQYLCMPTADPALRDPAVEAEGIRATGLVPIVHDGRPVAMMLVASRVMDDVPGHSRRALEAIGAQIAAAIARFQAHEAIAQREAQLAAFFGTAAIGIALLDAQCRITRANDLFRHVVGRGDQAELEGQDVCLLLGEDPELAQAVASITANGAPQRTEIVHAKSGGTPVCLDVSLAPILDRDGAVSALVMLVSDITDRRQAEEALRQSEAKYRTVFEASPEVIVLLGPDGTIAETNGKARQWIGSDVPLGPGLAVGDLPFVSAEAIALLEASLERRLAGETVPPYTLEFIDRDGHRRVGRVSGSAIRAADGAVEGAIALIADVTELERLQAKLRQAHKLESLGVLAGGIAHDFNNLLHGILGNAELASMQASAGSSVSRHLRSIESMAQRAAHLSAQMLAYSGHAALQSEPLALSSLAEEVCARNAATAGPTVQFTLDLDPTLPPIQGDREQLAQVLQSLLANAVEAIGEAPGRVTVRTSLTTIDESFRTPTHWGEGLPPGAYVVLRVTDDGSGMDAETLSRAFDPFFTTKFTGRGLGLAAAMGVVRGHKGAIVFESEPGRGTSAGVLLPVAGDTAVPPQSGHSPTECDPSALVVLVVDDEPEVRTIAQEVLSGKGFDVLVAADGEAALDLATQQGDGIGVVLMDLTMPGMGGARAHEALAERHPQIPVVICSGYAEDMAREKLGGRPVAGFLRKPYRLRELVDTVSRILAPASRCPECTS